MAVPRNNLRLLVLALNLVNTELGLSKGELAKRVPGYSEMTPDTFERTFERDISSLRQAGLIINLSSNHPPRYSVEASSFVSEDISFSAHEAEIVTQAVHAWQDIEPKYTARMIAKLAPYFDGSVDGSSVYLEAEGARHLEVILRAIERQQPISFTYAGRSNTAERDVAPWALEARGAALYLRGFDLNRWDSRMFRLSRILGDITLIAEEGAFDVSERVPGWSNPDEMFTVAPLLLVRDGGASTIRLRLENPKCQEHSAPDGWQFFLGKRDERAIWERLIYDHLEDVIVVEPKDMRDAVIRNLEMLGGTDGR